MMYFDETCHLIFIKYRNLPDNVEIDEYDYIEMNTIHHNIIYVVILLKDVD